MPAHIFLQLGRWDEAAAADEAALGASDAGVRRRGLPQTMRSYHSLAWLQYSRLQQGRYREARAAIEEVAPVAAASDLPVLKGLVATLRARYVVEAQAWQELQGRRDYGNADELFALGAAAARTGRLDLAAQARDRLAALAARDAAAEAPDARGRAAFAAIMARELAGLVALAAGDPSHAVAALEEAARLEEALPPPVGPPVPIKPARELLGEVLVEIGRPVEAIPQLERALARTRNRSAALLALARAATRARRADLAERSYAQLLENWRSADPDLPAVAEARAALAKPAAASGPDRRLRLGAAATAGLTAIALIVLFRRRRTRRSARPAKRR